ncbi:ABC transporter, partial [Streptomyces sp. SID10116]|nr:ABC transporter [Streptomyces sp. SID10116]
AAPDGTTRLTVPRPHSDRILRELLTARPPWHVVAVSATADAGSREAPGEGRGEEL